ncbi:winged helix DNA-binding protein [Novosphingobium sp. TH158]|uniref:winged helix DNA-binding protein n=1 Tax=Novosphingobium sp. TH158 TaxID=2067455 RepID=UPI0011818029|nr:winged helix DNA-binding protein [Novosphingobium sp. TH158]
MANELLSLAEDIERGDKTLAANVSDQPSASNEMLESVARAQYRVRRLRGQFFEDDAALFGEPAWDLLLDLFIADCEGKSVPVTSACIGACVPTTTALRWLAVLESKGLLEREADARDARRVFVNLTDFGRTRMREYIARIAQEGRGDDPRPSFMLGK